MAMRRIFKMVLAQTALTDVTHPAHDTESSAPGRTLQTTSTELVRNI